MTSWHANTDFDPVELHRATHGNAFFVTEIINSRSETLPESIRDAVIARASRLPEFARRPLDAASIVPGRVEPWLLAAIATDAPSGGADVDLDLERGIDECVDRGLLHYDASGALEFNHELARLAIAGALSPARARAYHGRALSALERAGDFAADPARLAFHAAEAADADAVIRYAPVAAEHAGAVGAHQEACVHLANALAQRARMSAADRARLHGLHGAELVMLGRTQEAVDAYDAAIAIHAANADPESEAWALVMTDRPLVLAGRQLEADARIDRAQALLENRPPSRAAAMLATCQSATNMLARRFDVCRALRTAGDRAGRAGRGSRHPRRGLDPERDRSRHERRRPGPGADPSGHRDRDRDRQRLPGRAGLLADRIRLRRAACVRRRRAGAARRRCVRRCPRVRIHLLHACLARSMRAGTRSLGDRRRRSPANW